MSARVVRCWSGLAALLVLSASAHAYADEASGTWTGSLEGRLNYYWERSTRVEIPAAKVNLEAPNGVRVGVSYLVDVIASASIAQTGGNSDGVFTELRHGVGVTTGKKFALGDNDLDLSAHAIFSTEDDYTSWIGGINGSFTFDDKDSTILLGLTGVRDTIYNNLNPAYKKHLTGFTTSLGFSEVLSPTMILGLGYEFVVLDGFLGNPYRNALIGPLPHAEAPPDQRLRHNAEAQLSWFLPPSATTLQLYGRAYLDSWRVGAITPEVRVYQQLSAAWLLRLRYRFYDQTRADFALKSGETRYPVGYTGALTSDPKLSAFSSQQLGIKFELALAGLGGTFLDFARLGVLDLSFDYQWCTSSFGNNVIATVGAQLPF
jgi:opacity protein-like surface antigen